MFLCDGGKWQTLHRKCMPVDFADQYDNMITLNPSISMTAECWYDDMMLYNMNVLHSKYSMHSTKKKIQFTLENQTPAFYLPQQDLDTVTSQYMNNLKDTMRLRWMHHDRLILVFVFSDWDSHNRVQPLIILIIPFRHPLKVGLLSFSQIPSRILINE